jgi:hypothetical protein
MYVITETFKTRTALEDLNLKTVFRSNQEILNHSNKELRDFAV